MKQVLASAICAIALIGASGVEAGTLLFSEKGAVAEEGTWLYLGAPELPQVNSGYNWSETEAVSSSRRFRVTVSANIPVDLSISTRVLVHHYEFPLPGSIVELEYSNNAGWYDEQTSGAGVRKLTHDFDVKTVATIDPNGFYIIGPTLTVYDGYIGYDRHNGEPGGVFIDIAPPAQSLAKYRVRVWDITDSVPEPATWVTMILGFGLVGGALRRQSPKLA